MEVKAIDTTIKNIQFLLSCIDEDLETLVKPSKEIPDLIVCNTLAVEAVNRCKAAIELDLMGFLSEVSVVVRSGFSTALALLDLAVDKTGRSLNRYMAVRHKLEKRFGNNLENDKFLSSISPKDHVNWKVKELIARAGMFDVDNMYTLYQWHSSFEHCDGYSVLAKIQFPENVRNRNYLTALIITELLYIGFLELKVDLRTSLYIKNRHIWLATYDEVFETDTQFAGSS